MFDRSYLVTRGIFPELARGWLDINACKRKHSLQNRGQTDEDHEQLKELCQPAVTNKLVDHPKTDRTHDNNNQNTDQN